MRDDWQRPRGEAERVAARVRELLDAHRGDADVDAAEPSDESVGEAGRPSTGAPTQSALGRLLARLPVRVDPGRRSALAVGVAVLVAAVLTGFWMVSAQPRSTPVSATGTGGSGAPLIGSGTADATTGPVTAAPSNSAPPGTGASASSAATSAPSQVVVDVAGKVRRPGVYRLPTGSRVDDAVRAAGGSLPGVDLSCVNLAAVLVDGQQIAVGRPGAVAAPPGAGGTSAAPGAGSGGSSPTGPVDLNTATLEQLETLPGIGPALGQRILDYRSQHGSFSSVSQLDDVSGIGTVIFARLKPLVTV